MNKWSNCLIAAIRAKIKYGKKVKVVFINPFKNDVFCPHFMWSDDKFIYDWYSEKNPLKWYEQLWHKGVIRKRPIETYERWVQTRKWR